MFVSRNALTRGFLSNEAGEGGAGGGAAGGTEAPKPMTSVEIGNMVNGAISAKLKKELGPSIAEALKTVSWKDIVAPIVTELVPKPAETQATGQLLEAKPDPRLSALEGKYTELEKTYQAEKAARVEAESRSRDSAAFAALKTALTDHVRPDMLEIAARDLFLSQKRVTFDENGRPLLTVKKAPFQGGEEEEVQLTLQDGAAHWAKTEGKVFAPPPQGAGVRGAGPGPRHVNTGRDGLPVYDAPANSDSEKLRRASEQAEALARKYPHIS